MGLLLNIDTSTEKASVCLGNDGKIIGTASNDDQKDHASWLHTAIKKLIDKSGTKLNELDAIAITAGPGSYTGLRVGMAAAKGLCYALNKPLIVENTLKVMAYAATKDQAVTFGESDLLCPMIDARRMEVFTNTYTPTLEEIYPSRALILDENSFKIELDKSRIYFFGSGSIKWKPLCAHINAFFINANFNASHLFFLADQKFKIRAFADLAYVEPLYIKEFYTVFKK